MLYSDITFMHTMNYYQSGWAGIRSSPEALPYAYMAKGLAPRWPMGRERQTTRGPRLIQRAPSALQLPRHVATLVPGREGQVGRGQSSFHLCLRRIGTPLRIFWREATHAYSNLLDRSIAQKKPNPLNLS